MNQTSLENGITDEVFAQGIENMFDNTNIYVLLEIYYRETAYSHTSDFLDRLTKYLQKHGMIS